MRKAVKAEGVRNDCRQCAEEEGAAGALSETTDAGGDLEFEMDYDESLWMWYDDLKNTLSDLH